MLLVGAQIFHGLEIAALQGADFFQQRVPGPGHVIFQPEAHGLVHRIGIGRAGLLELLQQFPAALRLDGGLQFLEDFRIARGRLADPLLFRLHLLGVFQQGDVAHAAGHEIDVVLELLHLGHLADAVRGEQVHIFRDGAQLQPPDGGEDQAQEDENGKAGAEHGAQLHVAKDIHGVTSWQFIGNRRIARMSAEEVTDCSAIKENLLELMLFSDEK